ncbi:WAT1-related protein [Canna indica]|uniref:WAT1-related protein n=1 Tax=Canna indica TaxID=4628 RepID=A0AAQ3QK96_9LILI|nr:WAT1-related protein [Canna indica]
MSTCVFVFYRQLSATLILLPLAFVFERKRAPALPFRFCFRMFMLVLIGVSGTLNLTSVALSYTSATSVSATGNFIPVSTFILAVLFRRMEKVELTKKSGIAKIFAVGLCVAGVLAIAFYNGPHLKPLSHHHILQQHGHHQPQLASHSKWVLGTFINLTSNITWSLWLVLQGSLLKDHPISQLMFTTLQSLFSAIQTFFIALAVERDFSRWKLRSKLSLISIAYCGIVVSGIAYFLQSWTIQKKGPIFLTMTSPITLIITTILSSFLLGEFVSLESILGGTLMVGGLYCFLWGKRREQEEGEIPTSKDNTPTCLEEQETVAPPVEAH